MARYTVMIKNRLENDKQVARICSFETSEYFGEVEAGMSANIVKNQISCLIDNDIYFADVEEEQE